MLADNWIMATGQHVTITCHYEFGLNIYFNITHCKVFDKIKLKFPNLQIDNE